MQYLPDLRQCGLCDGPAVVRFFLATDDTAGPQVFRCAHHWAGTAELGNLAAAARPALPLRMVVDLTFTAAAVGRLCACGLPAGHKAGPPDAESGRQCRPRFVTGDEIMAGAW